MVTLNLTEEQANTLLGFLYGEVETLRHDQNDTEAAGELDNIANKLQHAR